MEYIIKPERVRWANKTLRRFVPQIDEDTILDIAEQCGLMDFVSLSDDQNGIEFDFETDVQLIAFAAALSAVCEVMRAGE